MSRPLIYEINTRCWLRELAHRRGEPVRLANIPDDEFARWSRWGVTHLWLMGIWTTGPRSRDCYLKDPRAHRELDAAIPGWDERDVPGSPYAIAEYRVPDELGGEPGLQQFRERLHRHGIQLILDFVPNHVGLDHRWVREKPELMVRGRDESPESFLQTTRLGTQRIAHGKDPHFPVWNDTAQLDHRSPATRAAVIEELQSVAARCDGVRCDMAMLVLNDVFARTWNHHPSPYAAPTTEFWSEAIAATKRTGFVFIAEAYWDLEERLQSLGFDFTYDKRVTDFVFEARPEALRRHLSGRSDDFHQRSVHFLENHDEPRAAGRLALTEHGAVAFLTLALPGVALLHEGQTDGARFRVPVQWGRRPSEPLVPEISRLYDRLLGATKEMAGRAGQGQILRVGAHVPSAARPETVVAILWPAHGREFQLAVVNLGREEVSIRADLPEALNTGGGWRVTDALADAASSREFEFPSAGLPLLIPAFGAQLLRFQPR